MNHKDEVQRRLDQIARQGLGMSRLAHACAGLLIVLFSLGSLVALSGEQLQRIITLYQHSGMAGVIAQAPLVISIAVSTLLVLCFDVGLVYAATKVRVLRVRQQDADIWPHAALMVFVGAIEAATYLSMSLTYESPHTALALGLILARAASAPVLSVYLSLASPTPLTAKDILYEVELAVGTGLVRDTVALAADPGAQTQAKYHLYRAASVMTATDSRRLEQMVLALPADSRPIAPRQTLAQQIAAALDANHTLTKTQLAGMFGCSPSHASALKRRWAKG